MTGRSRARRGMVMLLVIWASLLLAALVLPLVDESVGAARLAAADFDRLSAELAARAGLARAFAELIADAPGADGLRDRWSTNDLAFREVRLGDRQSYSVLAGGDGRRTARYGVVDEDRKIGVWTAPARVLERTPGMPRPILDRLLALRASGEPPRRSVRSLLGIPGMTPEIFYGEDWNEDGLLQENEDDGDRSAPPDDADGVLRPGLICFLSSYTDGKVNVNTAAVEVLAALPMLTADQAARIVEVRGRVVLPARSVAELVRAAGLPDGLTAPLSEVAKVTSEVFHVHSRGTVEGSATRVSIEVVVRRRERALAILYYRVDQ